MKWILIATLFATIMLASCNIAPAIQDETLKERYAQERCVGDSTKFACTTSGTLANTETDTLTFEISNGAGEDVAITGVSASQDGSCGTVESWTVDRDGTIIASEEVASEPVAPNDEVLISVTCSDDIAEGTILQDTFRIDYDIVDGIPGLYSRIEIVKKV